MSVVHKVGTLFQQGHGPPRSSSASPKPEPLRRSGTRLSKVFGPLAHLEVFKGSHSQMACGSELFGMLKILAADSAEFGGSMGAEGDSTPINYDSSFTSSSSRADSADSLEIRRVESPVSLPAGAGAETHEPQAGSPPTDMHGYRDILGGQLAALSINNLRDLLPSEHQADQPIATHATSVLPTGIQSSGDPALRPALSDATKLEVIQKEFGDIAGLMHPRNGGEAVPERILAEATGSLFKGVLMIGNLNLTTHRLLFHAVLPPEPKETETQSTDSRQAAILSGTVRVHKPGPLAGSHRVWMEVGPQMITTYPNGDDKGRDRPLQCILLSVILNVDVKEGKAGEFEVTYQSPKGPATMKFSVDSDESAMRWGRAIEGALFHQARKMWQKKPIGNGQDLQANTEKPEEGEWTMLRCCVPLDRVTVEGVTDYHAFATLVDLEIAVQETTSSGKRNPHWFLNERARFTPSPRPPSQDSVDRTMTRSSSASSQDTLQDTPSASPLGLEAECDSDRDQSTRSKSAGILSPIQSGPRPGSSSNVPHRGRSLLPKLSRSPPVDPKLNQPRPMPWIDPAFSDMTRDSSSPDMFRSAPSSSKTEFKLALLNEQAWFVNELQKAIENVANLEYRAEATPPRMIMEVGGHDCLETDDESEREAGVDTLGMSTATSDSGAMVERSMTNDDVHKAEVAAMAAKSFGLEDLHDIYVKRCYLLHGLVPLRGHIIITPKYFCFWRRATVGQDVKYRVRIEDIKGAVTRPGSRPTFHGMTLNCHGRPDLKFDFWQRLSRDEVLARISHPGQGGDGVDLVSLPTREDLQSGPRSIQSSSDEAGQHAADVLALHRDALEQSKVFPDKVVPFLPFVANKPRQDMIKLTPRHFICLTIGSRGDVQPYIALALRLKKDGHRATIVTHNEFKTWIEGYGIQHRQAGGDPTALMKLSADHKMFSPGFFKETLGSFRQWLDDLLVDSWHACHDADVLIESPSTMSGIHIAEALDIPYFRAFTMPWTRTTAYPQAFMVPAFDMGPTFNYSTYVLFDNIMWRATSGQINKWRRHHLHLKSTDMSALSVSKVPFLYNFSPAVVPKPLDWHDNITITGYWNLEDSDTEWTPPPGLSEFMAKAKEDGKALVYIGFGSIVVPHPNKMTEDIITAVQKADVRAIVAKGWSSRGSDPATEGNHIDFPPECFGLEKVPHGWLFPKIDAALHHGGAGTVGASLRAGIPTLIKPWFGDQFFWAIRVTKLGVGHKVSSTSADDIAEGLLRATTDKNMIEKAARVGERIRSEDGVETALSTIHAFVDRAGTRQRK